MPVPARLADDGDFALGEQRIGRQTRDGLGAVDLTVDLGPGANPYNYSDMTGAVALGATANGGFWTVTFDSEATGTAWGQVDWTAEEPAGSLIEVEVRAADTEAALGSAEFRPVLSGAPFCDASGRFLQIAVRFTKGEDQVSPILYDLSVADIPRTPGPPDGISLTLEADREIYGPNQTVPALYQPCIGKGVSNMHDAPTWDPQQYLRHSGHRTRPFHDLLNRIPDLPRQDRAARIADLGCGPGNVTTQLTTRWPGAHITGYDNSPEMLKEAETYAGPTPGGGHLDFAPADAADWQGHNHLLLKSTVAVLIQAQGKGHLTGQKRHLCSGIEEKIARA